MLGAYNDQLTPICSPWAIFDWASILTCRAILEDLVKFQVKILLIFLHVCKQAVLFNDFGNGILLGAFCYVVLYQYCYFMLLVGLLSLGAVTKPQALH
jgi:hypothetical protein